MTKYYTPDLSEMRLNFEYQEKKNGTWHNDIILNIDDLDYIFDICTHTKESCLKDIIRVKHLDEDDVQSLGFTLERSDDISVEFIRSDFILYFKSDKKRRFVTIYDDAMMLKFAGRINNKIELCNLLKQL